MNLHITAKIFWGIPKAYHFHGWFPDEEDYLMLVFRGREFWLELTEPIWSHLYFWLP